MDTTRGSASTEAHLSAHLSDSSIPLLSPLGFAASSSKNMHPTFALLSTAIRSSLSSFLFENAVFLGERLVAYFPTNPHASYLLACSYYACGKLDSACGTLKSCSIDSGKYLLARILIDLNRGPEAELVLTDLLHCPIDADDVDRGSVLCLLGQICRNSDRHAEAKQYFERSLNENAFLWTSFKNLAELGKHKSGDVSIDALFAPDKLKEAVRRGSHSTSTLPPVSIQKKRSASSLNTSKATQLASSTQSSSARSASDSAAMISSRQHGVDSFTSLRRSTRLTSSGPPSANTTMISSGIPKARPLGTTAARDRKRTRPPPADSSKIPATTTQDMDTDEPDTDDMWSSEVGAQMLEHLSLLLRTLAHGYDALCDYRCEDALRAFDILETGQYSTGWVLSQIGRAHFEMVQYTQAENAFQRMRELDPFRMDNMDLYSSALWHLKKDVQLSYLAHELVEANRKSPQAWCAVANSFSLRQEHADAIKALRRALQLDPHFAYAYTLCGHEYIAMDDLEKALGCFRQAVRVDDRHYNAWYGLGYAYYEQEQLELAEFHFRTALEINRHSVVILMYTAMTLQRRGKMEEALALYLAAEAIHPRNSMLQFRKAVCLMNLTRYQDALEILEQLKETSMSECNVHFVMGRIYQTIGDRSKAILAYTMAQDYSSARSCGLVKDAIESVFNGDEQELRGDIMKFID
ncbi:hypothetical protein BJ742DRAFT_854013 [Cladochytrium replicatum]|nr:hypothetical protein BJ742DRAFT_854013 [Cladochytrium replicatum]